MDIQISLIKHDSLDGLDPEVIAQIASSIDTLGLMHPITVLATEDGFELMTGKKRLAAVMKLGCNTIPATVLTVGRERAMEVALHENLRRANLPWWEIVELESQLHQLRVSQHGQRPTGRPRKGASGSWSLSDTAEELGRAIGAVSQDLQFATILKLNPHLKNVQDKATALKLARQIAKRESAEMDALEIAQDTNLLDSVLNGDSLHVLSQIPADVFHVCITDPPWSDYKDESLTADASTLPIFKEVYRTLKYNSLLYMVVSTPDFFMYSQELPKFGFKVQKHPLIWAKEGTITHGKRGWEYARDYEPILLAAKGDPLLTTATEQSAVITTRAVRSIDLTHPHEKPVELIARLLKDSTYEGSWALDPFGGSGVLAAACLQSGRHYMIIERNRKFYEQIVKRANAGRS